MKATAFIVWFFTDKEHKKAPLKIRVLDNFTNMMYNTGEIRQTV